MPKIKTLCLFWVMAGSTSAQSAIELGNIRVLHAGIENPLTVIVNEVPDSCIVLQVSAGNVIRYPNGRFSWGGIPAGDAVGLLVLDGCQGDTLATRRYRVLALEAVPLLNGAHKSKIMHRREFMAQSGISAILVNTDIDGFCSLAGFWAEIIDGATGDAWMGYNVGGRFNESFLKRRAMLKAGDIVRFYAIRYTCPGDALARFGAPLVFKIR